MNVLAFLVSSLLWSLVSFPRVQAFQLPKAQGQANSLVEHQQPSPLSASNTRPEILRTDMPEPFVFPEDGNSLEIPPLPKVRELPLIQLALAGSITTFFTDLTMHPVDCIKTIQQSDLGVNFGMLDAAHYLYDKDGVFGFFHGFLTYAASDACGGALKFGVWETWKKKTSPPAPVTGGSPTEPSIWIVMMGAALAFVASSFIIVPGELLKQQLQMSHYDGLMDAIKGIAYAEDGSFNLKGFFAGYDGVLYRDIPYTILELGLYDMFKRFLGQLNPDKEETYLDQLLCAAVTGGIVAVATTPMDVIKTKLMVDNYASFADCLLSTVQNHGVGAVFSGVYARVAWIVPFTAIYLSTYDRLKEMLWKRHMDHIQNKGLMNR